ncbi:hypothetical protein V6N11_036720 [Hibiscus sabdariffa]|uniref:Uncharacterized protein n=1 Tax=Hibiscus sabdariffa TaxID=183260 RepID=A0ABR2RBZ8_9ROSI
MDHNTDAEEEVERIGKEHPDDEEAVVNKRVKGYLKYFTNHQVVHQIDWFTASFPNGDPPQYLYSYLVSFCRS